MEKHRPSSSCGFHFVLQILSLCILFSYAKAENKTAPWANVNLSPIQAWRSAIYCLQFPSPSCNKYTLNQSGWLNVTRNDGASFCQHGCADNIRTVLKCLWFVKKDFKFGNSATIHHLSDTINIGCDPSQGFNGTSLYSSSGFRTNAASVPFFMAISASALILVALL